MSSKVNIVISTYNGEKYIKEQLDSLLKQSHDNIDIYVRDDGSDDNTVSILEEYQEKYGIHLIKGKNMGFSASFFEVLKIAEDGDYWSFCDQDDIWMSDKTELAVEWLDRQNQTRPLLYYSLSEMFDMEGKKLGVQRPPKNSLNFRRAMTGTFGVGFSMVINRTLRNEMLKANPYKVHSHDWLAGAIALGFGEVYVNEKICAKYRRLDTSVTKISFSKKMKWLCSMLKADGDVKERNAEYVKLYMDRLDVKKQKVAELFVGEKYSIIKSLKKVFYLKRWRPNISSEVIMRFLMLIGKV